MIRLLLHELRAQQLLFWRSREAAFFTFLLPIIFLVLLGSVYGDDEIDGIKGSTYLLAGLLGYGVIARFVYVAVTTPKTMIAGVKNRAASAPKRTLKITMKMSGNANVKNAAAGFRQNDRFS